jgi:hypothetical protein
MSIALNEPAEAIVLGRLYHRGRHVYRYYPMLLLSEFDLKLASPAPNGKNR